MKRVLVLVCSTAAFFGGSCERADPPISEQFALLERHYDDFTKLKDMFLDDSSSAQLTQVSDSLIRLEHEKNWPRPESRWGITKKRWDEYVELMDQLGVSDIVFVRSDVPSFINYSHGMLGKGWSGGLAWSANGFRDINTSYQTVAFTTDPGRPGWAAFEQRYM